MIILLQQLSFTTPQANRVPTASRSGAERSTNMLAVMLDEFQEPFQSRHPYR